jgi:hypothetical protein
MIDEPPFWMVWNPDHPETPKTRYPTRAAAQSAARKMAEKFAYLGAVFFVLKAQSAHQRQVQMCDFIMSEWGIGAPCPYHHTNAQRRARS